MVIHRYSLSVANTGTGMLGRRFDGAQRGDTIHYGATDLLIKLLDILALAVPGKGNGVPVENGHGTETRPRSSWRQDVERALEKGRNHGTSGLRHKHTDPWFSGLQPPIQAATALRKDHHDLSRLDQSNRLPKCVAIKSSGPQGNPSQPLTDGLQARNRKEIAAPQEPSPPTHPATQERDVHVAGMIRRHNEPTRPWNCSDNSIAKTAPTDGSDKNPQDPVDERTHNLAVITAIS